MNYELPKLPFDVKALEPHIDGQTLEIHHGKHHNKYVSKLNDALEGHEKFATEDIAELMPKISHLPDEIRTAVQHNGGQHYNHSLYWQCMRPPGKNAEPTGQLAEAIASAFGDFATFQNQFSNAAATCFGSGWAWLYVDDNNKLAVCATSNEVNPLMSGIAAQTGRPLLVVDVWEHAYYLKYQNRRPDYLQAWWNVVDWDKVAQRFEQAGS